MNEKKIYDELIKILLKKAKGFYYTEEQEEYEKTQNKSKKSEIYANNLSFFEKIDTPCTQNKTTNDMIKTSNETQKETSDLTLVKKKITTHYISPDMLAVKILFEIIEKKVNENDLETLSDDELLNLKEKLLGELNNEN